MYTLDFGTFLSFFLSLSFEFFMYVNFMLFTCRRIVTNSEVQILSSNGLYTKIRWDSLTLFTRCKYLLIVRWCQIVSFDGAKLFVFALAKQ